MRHSDFLLSVGHRFLSFASTYPSLDGKEQDLPGSWTTLRWRAAFSDPGDPLDLDRQADIHLACPVCSGVAFHGDKRVGIATSFRGSITRPARPLSTLRSQGHPWATQDSLSDGGRVPPVGTLTHGLLRSVSALAFSFPRLVLAQCPQEEVVPLKILHIFDLVAEA
jgi:hypothetical protein